MSGPADFKEIVFPVSDFPFWCSVNEREPDYYRNLQTHIHTCLEISRVKRGRLLYFVDGRNYLIGDNDIIFFNDKQLHSWMTTDNLPILLHTFVFYPQLIWSPANQNTFEFNYLLPFSVLGKQLPNKIPTGDEVAEKIGTKLDTILKEYKQQEEGYELVIKSYLLEILSYLYRYYKKLETREEHAKETDSHHYRINKIVNYIYANFDKEIDLNSVASFVALSPNYFSTYFKDAFGVSFVEYLTKVRVMKALSLLRTTDKTIPYIAYECGFNSVSNFYQAFKKNCGNSPNCYRK